MVRGGGITQPYTLMFADNVTFGVNKLSEQIRFTGQTSKPVSDDIAKVLAGGRRLDRCLDRRVLALPLSLIGQKFLLLQAPFATESLRYQRADVYIRHPLSAVRLAVRLGRQTGAPDALAGLVPLVALGRDLRRR